MISVDSYCLQQCVELFFFEQFNAPQSQLSFAFSHVQFRWYEKYHIQFHMEIIMPHSSFQCIEDLFEKI